MRRNGLILLVVSVCSIVGLASLAAVSRQGEAFPLVFSGQVAIQGAPAPADLSLVACVLDCATYKSGAVLTTQGGYRVLTVGPPGELLNKQITFWIENKFGEIMATETDVYEVPDLDSITRTLSLTFNDPLPAPAPTPPPTITPTPIATPVLPIPGDSAFPTIVRVVLIVGIAALLAGGTVAFIMRRRRAF